MIERVSRATPEKKTIKAATWPYPYRSRSVWVGRQLIKPAKVGDG